MTNTEAGKQGSQTLATGSPNVVFFPWRREARLSDAQDANPKQLTFDSSDLSRDPFLPAHLEARTGMRIRVSVIC
jgi:hypothetical protein